MSYKHFTLDERKYLQELISEGKSFREIAKALGRAPSSISREVKRNHSKNPKNRETANRCNYHHWRANILSIQRRRNTRKLALPDGSEAQRYVVEKLSLFWSPEQIAALYKIQHQDSKLSFSTIYRYIKRKYLPDISAKTHLRRKGKNSKLVRRNCNVIHPDRIIPDWPEEIVNRTRIGDWEGDTVYGGIGKGLIVTLVDRKSRFLCARLISSRDALLTEQAIVEALKNHVVKSISLDNGSEFAEFHKLEAELNTTVFFAEPHKPWQRGTNENTNDILRFYFPKGFDFTSITQDDLDFVVDQINHRPRKVLEWKTPAECVALT